MQRQILRLLLEEVHAFLIHTNIGLSLGLKILERVGNDQSCSQVMNMELSWGRISTVTKLSGLYHHLLSQEELSLLMKLKTKGVKQFNLGIHLEALKETF
jgi:hypothetical protein